VLLEAHSSFHIIEGLYKIHLFVYLYGSYRLITKYKQDIEQVLSNQPESNINRLVNILLSVFLLWLSWILVYHVSLPTWAIIHLITTLFCLYYIFYSAIKQEPIMDIQAMIHDIETLEEHNETIAKEITPQMLVLKAELEAFMVSQKPFLDPELSLQKLAEKLNVSLHFLSHTINTCFEENFFQFINRYRVEESKILLRHPDMSHYNILQIAYEAGFNSKTTFNTTFKKMTGVSPSAYQKTA
jgi:AraC-like DNA-binding protein